MPEKQPSGLHAGHRKRMREEDHEHARLSAVKREQNLEELRRKNNTRVLEALMEDLMEVV